MKIQIPHFLLLTLKLPLVRRAPFSAIAYAETGGAARLRVALRALATPRLGFLPFGL